MKLRKIITEGANRAVYLAFIKWLKQNNLTYELVAGGKGKDSNYIEVEFDNGTNLPETLKIRFSNHSARFRPVDIDTYQDHINSLEDIFKELHTEYGLVIKGGKYLGQEFENGYDNAGNKIKKPIPVKRG